MALRQVILDTETTGLSAENGDRVVEIGCVELVGRRLTGRNLHFYLNPERDSHEEALRVHGLTSEFLADKPKFAQIAAELSAYLDGAEIIIHNAAFDVGFLDKEFERAGMPPLDQFVETVTDTLRMAKTLYPGKRNSLDALCERLGVDNSGRTLHGALLDAELLADVYIALTRGQETLLMDLSDARDESGAASRIDLNALTLPVLRANEAELAGHERVLAEIDKASGAKTVWRSSPVA
ncbi:MAG TPA: DNA polymerase III subunit epsilon [Burkholderiaceae bacterium]|jgi:DNA polymerase-3 subunit epsilon|nr:DNA polymerase III subunit epsilon [Burkholderiaceae bacterium]